MSAAIGCEGEGGSGLSLADLKPVAHALSPEDFEARHGSAFLLAAAARPQPGQGPCATQVAGPVGEPRPGDATAGDAQLVHPLRRGAHSVAPFVALGRTPNNDIVLADVTVSRFHAFFKRSADAASWRLQDAGSKNGTRHNGRPVPVQGAGEAPSLRSGDDLRFGSVELTFLDARALHAFLLAFE